MAIQVRDLPPSPMPDASSTNSQLQAQTLANQIVADARYGAMSQPVGRELPVANPYYVAEGATDLYNRTGIPPVMYQRSPYATAGYSYGIGGNGGVFPGVATGGAYGDPINAVGVGAPGQLVNMAPGRPVPLTGFPSAYPHVLFGGYFDTLAPYMSSLTPFISAAIQQLPAYGTRAGAAGTTRTTTPKASIETKKTTPTPTPAAPSEADVLGALARADMGVDASQTPEQPSFLSDRLAALLRGPNPVVSAELVPTPALQAAEVPALPQGRIPALPSGGTLALPPGAGGTAVPLTPSPRPSLGGGGAAAAIPEAPRVQAIEVPGISQARDTLEKVMRYAPWGANLFRKGLGMWGGALTTDAMNELYRGLMSDFDAAVKRRIEERKPTVTKR